MTSAMTGERFRREDALRLDESDPLRDARDRFVLPEGTIYLDGNSLGALPRTAAPAMAAAVEREWGADLIGGWNKGWLDLPRRIGAAIAPLIGAAPDEVLATDSVSANLFKLVGAALADRPGRAEVLAEQGDFATDGYVAAAAAAMAGRSFRAVPGEEIEAAIGADTAVAVLTHVHFREGRRRDVGRLSALARDRGAAIVWDLSHSAGAIPVELGEWGVELATGCGYKYLNGGPGAPAFLFVARAAQEGLRSPLAGWFGHARPFDFADSYEPAPGIDRFACGTPPVLAMTALREGVASFDGIDRAALFAKGAALGDLLIRLVEQECAGHGLVLASPRDASRRGVHVLFEHPHAFALCQALIRRGVIGDFRPPRGLRLGPAPLYTRHVDLWDAVAVLRDVLEREEWRRPEFAARDRVT